MKYRIVYLRLADKDLIEIFDYIKIDNPTAAQKLITRFERTVLRLSNFPFSGSLPREEALKSKGYRFLVIDDYLVFYLIRGKTIQIRRVIQGKRQYSFLL